jgi:aconitase A
MMRGTFGNIRLRNALVPGKEGPYTVSLPGGDETFIYDAAMRYRDEGVPLLIIAGREYGSGSSRDWAAKGTALLGIRAVIAESYERIHRSNLVGMGVLPLQFKPGDSASSLGLTGRETFTIEGLADRLAPRASVAVRVTDEAGRERRFEAIARLDERIHRSNLVGMGVLPLQFLTGENATSLGLTGRERYAIAGLEAGLRPRQQVTVVVTDDETGRERRFNAIARLDGPIEVEYLRHGGILPAVLRRLAAS